MMKIDAKLFANINNDATMSGTDLHGYSITSAITYLKQYIEDPSSKAPESYKKLMKELEFVVTCEKLAIEDSNKNLSSEEIYKIRSTPVTQLILSLKNGCGILLRGGWRSSVSSHIIIYEFSREQNSLKFTAYNTGMGSKNHAPKSTQDKELYNPIKVWEFPIPSTPLQIKELTNFIHRLILPLVISNSIKCDKIIDGDILYKQIFASISFIDGVEIDADEELKKRAADKGFHCYPYTSGQLGHTCTQLILHLLLKLNSESTQIFQRFMYGFKLHALREYSKMYTDAYNMHAPPVLTRGVQVQFEEAIINLLKILNIKGLFTYDEKRTALSTIDTIEKELNPVFKNIPDAISPHNSTYQQLSVQPYLSVFKINTANNKLWTMPTALPKPLPEDRKTLANILNEAHATIQAIKNPASKYLVIQKLLLQMPTQESALDQALIKDVQQLTLFNNTLALVQEELMHVHQEWLQSTQIPAFNACILLLINLQINANSALAKVNGLPSFSHYGKSILKSILGNTHRNPYIATNNPLLDKNLYEVAENARKDDWAKLENYCIFLNELINKDSALYDNLKQLYQKEFMTSASKLHKIIRHYHLESIYMITLDVKNSKKLDDKFLPLKNALMKHLDFETHLSAAIVPFFEDRYCQPKINIRIDAQDHFFLDTDLYPVYLHYFTLSPTLPEHKYNLDKQSPAYTAVALDCSNQTTSKRKIASKSANKIQLESSKKSENDPPNQRITQADVLARDYVHLRTVPSVQIALTIDYFNRNISMLSESSNQGYLEANLFQPPLLLAEINKPGFLIQLDRLLKSGLDYFAKNGQYTKNSLFFIRLDFLTSRYLKAHNASESNKRLETLSDKLSEQLKNISDPSLIHLTHQYLFLTLITLSKDSALKDTYFEQALISYFYLKTHSSPDILEDASHRFELEITCALFQNHLIEVHNQIPVLTYVNKIIKIYHPTLPDHFTIENYFPFFNVLNEHGEINYTVDLYAGTIYEKDYARSSLPLAIQNHPLIIQLGLLTTKECLVSANGNNLQLPCSTGSIYLNYNKSTLVIQKQWSISYETNTYELQALMEEDLVYEAQMPLGNIVQHELPKYFLAENSKYWVDADKYNRGILTQDNKPAYAIIDKDIFELNSQGLKTGYKLVPLYQVPHVPENHLQALTHFESIDFILAHAGKKNSIIKLPRYNLSFTASKNTTNPKLMLTDTNECLITSESPIDPRVAGLMLQAPNDQLRLLVPITRFYTMEQDTLLKDFYQITSSFYPITHDINNTLIDAELKDKLLTSKQKPLWRYQNSQYYASYKLHKGELMPDNVADALYLSYLYLATNKTKQAWKVLELCRTRFAGLTGDPREIKYIRWICDEMPAILPGHKNKEYIKRDTPPYVACSLKAMALLTHYFMQDKSFALDMPDLINNLANQRQEIKEIEHSKNFINILRRKIAITYTNYQTLTRYRSHHYTLSSRERKALLDFYHEQLPNSLFEGALAYEWMSLCLDTIIENKSLTTPNNTMDINELNKFGPVMHNSTKVMSVPVDLTINPIQKINKSTFNADCRSHYENWSENLINSIPDEEHINKSLELLSSAITENEFLANFPAYYAAATSQSKPQTEPLLDFCKKTLIANRNIPLNECDSNIPLLCNLLYRIMDAQVSDKTPPSINTLSDLIAKYAKHIPTPLKAIESKKDFDNILVTPETIYLQKKHRERIPLHLPKSENLSVIMQTKLFEINSVLLPEDIKRLENLIDQYNELGRQCDIKIKELSNRLTPDLAKSFVIEKEAGKLLLTLEQSQRQLARVLIDAPSFRNKILQATKQRIQSLTTLAKNAWDIALSKANSGPTSDAEVAQTWHIEKRAKSRPTLKHADLLSMYRTADATYSMQLTGMSLESVETVHTQINEALVLDIVLMCLVKIAGCFATYEKTPTIYALADALELLARPSIPGLDHPALVIFQHQENMLLRPGQVNVLEKLVKKPVDGKPFAEIVEKVTMGGGKSKVILPLAVELKPTGSNLVVVEVPPALLATYYVDLNRKSERLFGKHAVCFEFSRDSNCTPLRLQQIYNLFIEVMISRCYIVTTAESILSLELKYLELLLSEENDNDLPEQIFWCDKIIKLLQNNGDVLIDEVQHALAIKKKLNYTFGTPISIDPQWIKNAICLYTFIDPDFVRSAGTLPLDYNWTKFKQELASTLVTHENSPLYELIKSLMQRCPEDNVPNDLVAYLTNKAMKLSKPLLAATSDELAILAFFKQEINVFLPNTLSMKLDVHYGAPEFKNIDALTKTLAIPYEGNNKPLNNHRLGSEIKALNCSIQMMLIKGISKELLVEAINDWQGMALQEHLQRSGTGTLDQTPTAQGIKLLLPEVKVQLSTIDTKNSDQIDILHQQLKYHQRLIFNILEEKVLKLIQCDPKIIHGDCFNHVDQYRTTQGISGTPSNYTTFHRRLKYNMTSALGSDGYILQVIIDKQTSISSCDYQNIVQFLDNIWLNSKYQHRCRAIIDINATFTGENNSSSNIASQIARYIKKKSDASDSNTFKELEHVVYFNEAQVLCALRIATPDTPIILATSDANEINRILGNGPAKRLSYYDHIHTLGTDLEQADDAHALVLVDEKLNIQELLQGSSRMRGLSKNQSITFIVPTRISTISCSELFEIIAKNEHKALYSDNMFAAKAQIANYIRRSLLMLIKTTAKIKDKRKLIVHFQSFFIETPSLDYDKLYGAIDKIDTAKNILDSLKIQIESLWESCLEQAKLPPPNQTNKIELQQISRSSLPYLLPQYQTKENSLESTLQIQKEVQKHLQLQLQLQSLKDSYSNSLEEASIFDWYYLEIEAFHTQETYWKEQKITLNAMCSEYWTDKQPLFSNKLRASINYAKTYINQINYLNGFIKPIMLVWYHLDQKEKCYATLITNQDKEQIQMFINKNDKRTYSFIATTQDTVVAGNPFPNFTQNNSYLSLREQCRYFNGELNILLNQTTPLQWLTNNTNKKLAYFEKVLMPLRPKSENDFKALYHALTQANSHVFKYLSQHAFSGLDSFDWETIAPTASVTQLTMYKNVQSALEYVNNNWRITSCKINELEQKFQFPVSAAVIIHEHIELLEKLKFLLNYIENNTNGEFLYKVDKKQQEAFEIFLNMSPFKFTQFQNEYNLSPQTRISGSIKALLILMQHPALNDSGLGIKCFSNYVKKINSTDCLEQICHLKQSSPELVISIIANRNCTNKHILILLSERQLTTSCIDEIICLRWLTPEALNLIAIKFCHYRDTLMKLIKHSNADANLISNLIDNELFSLSVAKEMGKKLAAFHPLSLKLLRKFTNALFKIKPDQNSKSDPRLSILSPLYDGQHNVKNKDFLSRFIQETKPDAESITLLVCNLIKNRTLFENIPTDDLMKYASDMDIEKLVSSGLSISSSQLTIFASRIHTTIGIEHLLEKQTMSTSLAEELFKKPNFSGIVKNWKWITNAQQFTSLTNKAISYITEDQIISLCDSQPQLTEAQLNKCAAKIHKPDNIEKFLDHPKMTLDTARIVFEKDSFNGRIKEWPWLTNDSKLIVSLFDKACDFQSLFRLLRNKCISNSHADIWLTKLSTEQNASTRSSSHAKLSELLQKLKYKSCCQAVGLLQSRTDDTKIPESAYNLFISLNNITNNTNMTKASRLTECKAVIIESRNILNQHKAYKDILDGLEKQLPVDFATDTLAIEIHGLFAISPKPVETSSNSNTYTVGQS